MRIIQVAPYFHPHIGGVESHVMSLSEELVRRGHDVYVLTARLPGTKTSETLNGIKVLRSKPLVIWFKTPVIPGIKKSIKRLNGDVVHSHSPPPLPSYYAAEASRGSGTPFLITYHCDLEISSPIGGFVTEFYRRTYGASTIRKSDRVIVTTVTYGATSRTVWNANPVVIPNMVDIERFKPIPGNKELKAELGLPEDRPTVLFVGRLTRHKGVEYILEASRDIDAKFIVIGGGEYEAELKDIAKSLKVGGKVSFAGKVPDSRISKYLSASDVLVLPSTSRLEAFGIAALEAMASGTPVIISNIPGVREVITDGEEGLLVEPMNPEDLAAKISLILGDENKRKTMGQKARKKVEQHFSVEKVTDKIEKVYEELSVRGGRR
ncbi:MAG: glycosyltransferase family 4 protein [Thermoplasmata archaeon]|nr:glycosyltransferase family 4 protein [Thermoplasmata archaeon]